MTYTTSSRIHTKAARQAQLHICMHIYFICIPTPTIFTHIYNHRFMLAVPTAMLQSHGGSSLHCYPPANCLAAPFLSLSFSTTHTLNSLARPLSSQLIYGALSTSISLPSALRGRIKLCTMTAHM